MTDPNPAPTPDAPNVPTPTPDERDLHLKNIYELLAEGIGHLISRDRDEQRWRIVKRTALSAMVVGGVMMWLALYAPMLGWTSEPTAKSLGVVPVQGVIGQNGATADEVVPAIERACSSRQTQAVVLRITSPGGSPTDAERIAAALDACRLSEPDAKPKPVIAVIEQVGASAAYMIAVHTDEIVANRYAMVGSIGAVMSSFDAHSALDKLGVKERIYASGVLKAGNSPWSPNSAEQDRLSQELVDGVARMFIDEVSERRGAKLKPTPDMFSGRVWLSPTALELGLIDGVTTFEQLKAERFEDLPIHEFRPTKTLQEKLGLSALAREFAAGVVAEMKETQWN
ncbi:MAG: S49 family peptidase [Pseudomonas sp.]